MTIPTRLAPLLEQYDFSLNRLIRRMTGPAGDSGDDDMVEIPPMTDEEFRWEPVPGCWSVRKHADGPGLGATVLVGAGEWGRDGGRPRPYPPPFTTIAWRLSHLTEMLVLRADYTVGSHSQTEESVPCPGDAAGAIADFRAGGAGWREALTSADDAELDRVGRSQYPYGSDPENVFVETVQWVNQELIHHGAEIALLRDLFRAQRG